LPTAKDKGKKITTHPPFMAALFYLLIMLRPQLFRTKKFIKKKLKKYSVNRMVQLSDLSE